MAKSIFFLNSGVGSTPVDQCFNPGNALPTEAVWFILTGRPLADLPAESHHPNLWEPFDVAPLAERINAHTKCILFLQDQLRERISYYSRSKATQGLSRARKLIDALRVPLLVVGLGCNGFPPNDTPAYIFTVLNSPKREFLRALQRRAAAIGVRGLTTVDLLRRLAITSEPVGCPSIFLHGAAFRPLPPWREEGRLVTAGLVHGGDAYIAQDAHDDLTMAGDHVFVAGEIAEWRKFMQEGQFARYHGSRVHGAIVAITCGVPALVTNPDTRSREMCRLFRIPHTNNTDTLTEDLTYEPFNAIYPQLWQQFHAFLLRFVEK